MPDNKQEAVDQMESNLATLEETYAVLKAKRSDPNTSDEDSRSLLARMGLVNAQMTAAGTLLAHLRAAGTIVSAPPPKGELLEAMAVLERMKQNTNQVRVLLDLASDVVLHCTLHQAAVDNVTS